MFDLDPGKLVVFGIVALAVIPPKDLPRVLRTVGQYVGKMRRMASDFQGQFMDAMREAEKAAELDGVKKEFTALGDSAKIDTSYNPAQHVQREMTSALEAPKPSVVQTVDVSAPMVGMRERFSGEVSADVLAKPLEPPPAAAEPVASSHAP